MLVARQAKKTEKCVRITDDKNSNSNKMKSIL